MLSSLPPTFAVFCEAVHRPSFSTYDYVERRYKILTASRQRDVTVIGNPAIPLSSSFQNYKVQSVRELSFEDPAALVLHSPLQQPKLSLLLKNQVAQAMLWKSGWRIKDPATDLWIPVLDMAPHCELPGMFIYQVWGDTAEGCRERQREQATLRSRVMSALTNPTAPLPSHTVSQRSRVETPILSFSPPPHPSPPPRAPPPPREVPGFVAEALLESAIAKAQTCPITLSSFEAGEEVAVTPCFHLFGAEALASWRSSGQASCPVCKQEIGPVHRLRVPAKN
jgi:hypothetical protein